MANNIPLRRWIKLFAVGSLALFVTGCVSSEQIKDVDNVYFDLEKFLQQQMDTLARSNHTITKTIQFNEENEQQELTIGSTPKGAFPIATLLSYVRLQKELRPFLNAGINKPALIDQYNGDTSTYASGVIDSIQYQAKNDDQKTREMVINMTKEGDIRKVYINLVKDNPLYRSEQFLTFQPNKGYTIRGKQDVYFFEKDTFSIKGRW